VVISTYWSKLRDHPAVELVTKMLVRRGDLEGVAHGRALAVVEAMLSTGMLVVDGPFKSFDHERGTIEVEPPSASKIVLSEDQKNAWLKIRAWVSGTERFFVLRGFAGTGKTFLMKMLLEQGRCSLKFTAPTNKAAKVLAQTLGVQAGTIYSLLGLRMVPHEDGMRLEYPKVMPHVSPKTIVVIDEASMVGSELYKFVDDASSKLGFRVLYVGDPAQLNPVGEAISPAWKATSLPANRAVLKKVMRFDNELLALSVAIRDCLKEKRWVNPVRDDHSKGSGVFVLPHHKFDRRIDRLGVEDFAATKIVAWRNKTVSAYNARVRKNFGFEKEYEVGDVLLIGEPIEREGRIVAHTDEEGRATSVERTVLSADYEEVPVWSIVLKTDDATHQLYVPCRGDDTLQRVLADKAAKARNASSGARAMRWREFWEVKRKFHTVRYGYALTVHRMQGSTVDTVYVDQEDVLANPDKREAFRCLYVACTRPRFKLYTF